MAVTDRDHTPTSAPVLSVVIPAHNAADTLVEQLDGIAAGVAGRPVEIVVVDNRSTDATAAVVESWAAKAPTELDVRVVAAAEHEGAADEGAHPQKMCQLSSFR